MRENPISVVKAQAVVKTMGMELVEETTGVWGQWAKDFNNSRKRHPIKASNLDLILSRN